MESKLDRVNRRVYATGGALRQYGGLQGWLDAGERKAVDLARPYARSGKILDLGIGGGRTVALLEGVGAGYTGIDYTPRLLDAARTRHPAADLREMDARALAFPDASFRLVFFSFNGIDSVDPNGRARIVSEAWRVLEPGGVFAFSALNRNGSAYGERPLVPPARPRGLPAMLRAAKRAMLGTLNTARNRRLFREERDIALSTISVHDFGMVTVFVAPEAQVRELEQAGFKVVAVLDDQEGRDVTAGLSRSTAPWLYYIARKPESAAAARPADAVAATPQPA